MALDALARFEGRGQSSADVDRHVVTLPRRRPFQDLVSLLLRRAHSPSPWSSWEAPAARRMKRTGMPARASHAPVTGLAIPPKDPGNRCAAIISHARARMRTHGLDRRLRIRVSPGRVAARDVASPSPERPCVDERLRCP